MPNFDNLDPYIEIARSAGDAIMEFYHGGDRTAETKADNSPVTKADMAAHNIITQALVGLNSQTEIISEESYNGQEIGGNTWLVDPLDGTKEFIAGSKDFTVNIAYLQDYKPIFGIVYAPAHDKLYCGYRGQATLWHGNKKQVIRTRKVTKKADGADGLTACGSLRHDNQADITKLLRDMRLGDIVDFIRMGSSLKFCLIAEGSADIYGRLTPTHVWDSAAGDAVLRAAGGAMLTPEGADFAYGKAVLNGGFIALSGALSNALKDKP